MSVRAAKSASLAPWVLEWRDIILDEGRSVSWLILEDQRLTLLTYDISDEDLAAARAAYGKILQADRIEWQKARMVNPVR